ILFFFSSRRRHTRSKRDWSSDVCSSDLPCHGSAKNTTNTHPEIHPRIRPSALEPARSGISGKPHDLSPDHESPHHYASHTPHHPPGTVEPTPAPHATHEHATHY